MPETTEQDEPVRIRNPAHHEHHPWRAFGLLTDWRLEWTDDLPFGTWGLTLHAEKRVLLANGMDEAERRCTIEHERQHILRGAVPPAYQMREELEVDRLASRALMPSVRRVSHALAFHAADIEATAGELWVDETMLHVRLSGLAPEERGFLDEQMAHILL